MIVKFVFVRVHISDEVFLTLIVTFLEIFCLLCSPISNLSECHKELRQKKFRSRVIVLVNVCCFYPVGDFFHQYFLCFSKMLLGCMSFRQ